MQPNWFNGEMRLTQARAEADQVSFNVLFIHLVARALSEFPEMNCRLVENTIVQLEMVNIGLAIDTERGLVVPVIKNADRKSINEIRADVSRLMERVKQNRATTEDLSEGTFTITNLGSFGVDTFTPILNPPECGILGVGRIVQKLVVKEDTGAFMVRRMLNLSITFDHRLIDGVPAARFLAVLSRLIENPPKEV